MDLIGVALSGGGHRATVWGLGVLLRLVDIGANRQVTSIASVSGGSIANGVVAHEVDFRGTDPPAFEAAIRPALKHIAHDGLLFFGRPTNAYVGVVLVLGALVVALALATALVILLGAFSPLRVPVSTASLLLALLITTTLFIVVFGGRSVVTDRALAKVHFSDKHRCPTPLKKVDRNTHHVFCVTELQAADHCYFTPRAVYSYRLGIGEPGDLPLSTAVHCSACMPGAFSPRTLKAARFGFKRKYDAGEPSALPDRLVLSDGGVYDNMADQWEQGFSHRISRWPELPAVQEPADILIVANASKGWTWQPIKRLGVLGGEIIGLRRPIGVMYDVTTSRRRFEIVERFAAAETHGRGLRGVLVHIAQSPYGVPDRMVKDGNLSRAQRATEAILFLGGDENRGHWEARANASSGVPTVLRALGEQTTVDLLEHAYVLTMINAYVILGIGSLHHVDRSRFVALCRK